MTPTRGTILKTLPAYQDEWITVTNTQDVGDIIKDIKKAHRDFAPYYDKFAMQFYSPSIEQTCDNLYFFCKNNIAYQEESEHDQTTALPTGVLTRGHGDCKHYASFVGGCLAAISRQTGERINWHYCFASYEPDQKTPYHVFVVVDTANGPLWVDPTPGAYEKTPCWVVNEKVGDRVTRPLAVNTVGRLVNGTTIAPYPEPVGITPAQHADNLNILQQLVSYMQTIPATARAVPLTNYYYNQLADFMGYSTEASAGYNFETFRNWIQQAYPSVFAGIEAQVRAYGNAAADAVIKANNLKAVQAIPALVAAIATGNIKPFLAAAAASAATPINPGSGLPTGVSTQPPVTSGGGSGGPNWFLIGVAAVAFLVLSGEF